MSPATIRNASSNRLQFALSTAYGDALTHFAWYETPPEGPFALSLFDLRPSTCLTADDFATTQCIIDLMTDRRVAYFGTPGHDEPIEGKRYAVPGRLNLSVLEITCIKAAELLLTEADSNLALLHGMQKWPGACASFGGRRFQVSAGPGNIWPLAIAGSGYAPRFDQRITDGAAANVHYELIESGDVSTDGIISNTFILGAPNTWSYLNSQAGPTA